MTEVPMNRRAGGTNYANCRWYKLCQLQVVQTMPIAGGTNYANCRWYKLWKICRWYPLFIYSPLLLWYYLFIYSLLLWYHLFMYSPLLWYHLFLYKPLLFRYLGCRFKKTKSRTFFPMYFYYGVPILHQSIPCPPAPISFFLQLIFILQLISVKCLQKMPPSPVCKQNIFLSLLLLLFYFIIFLSLYIGATLFNSYSFLISLLNIVTI